MINSSFADILNRYIVGYANQNKGKEVLDIGCGGGVRTDFFHQANCRIIGVDEQNQLTKKYAWKFIKADAVKLPLKASSFDLVISIDVIEHIEADYKMIEEMHRVLKDGGTLLVGTPNINRFANKLRALIGQKPHFPKKIGPDCVHLREYTMASLVKVILGEAFRIKTKTHLWFGLSDLIGSSKFPQFLEKYCHYLFVEAIKTK